MIGCRQFLGSAIGGAAVVTSGGFAGGVADLGSWIRAYLI